MPGNGELFGRVFGPRGLEADDIPATSMCKSSLVNVGDDRETYPRRVAKTPLVRMALPMIVLAICHGREG